MGIFCIVCICLVFTGTYAEAVLVLDWNDCIFKEGGRENGKQEEGHLFGQNLQALRRKDALEFESRHAFGCRMFLQVAVEGLLSQEEETSGRSLV